MPKHIGIVAVSPEGSALCYRMIARRASQIADPLQRPLITLHNLPFANYLEAIARGDWEAVGTMLLWSSETLAAAGVDFCILPDNVAHHAIHFAEPRSPVPWVSMIDLVAEQVCDDRRRTVGIIGTKLVMNGSVYQTVLGLKGVTLLAPEGEDAEALDSIIFTELVEGQVNPVSQRKGVEIIRRLADRGCEGVILGSTEAPLLFQGMNMPLAMYDPVGLLVDGAIRRIVAGPSKA